MLLFDIVFKSGEFYGDEGSFIQDFIIAVVGAGIGAYVTFRVFRETLRNDREKEARQRADEQEKELKAKNDLESERLLYLCSLVENSISFIKLYLTGIEMFCKEIGPKTMELPPLNLPFTNDLKRVVYDIDREMHFHAYRNQIKDQNIFLLFSILDYFERVKTEIEKGMEKTIKDYHEQQSELIKEFDELSNLLVSYDKVTKDNQSELEENKIVGEALQNYINISRETPSDHRAVIDRVVNPLDQYQRSKYQTMSRLYRDVSGSANKALRLSVPMIALNQRCKSMLEMYSSDMKTELIKLIKGYKPLGEFCKGKFPV